MSDLLNSASLVMIPSGYKEDIVYSQIPTSGAGDLSFTRASNGTRVNSAGLVEVCPWNLLQYSENFSNSYWTKDNITITANATTNPVNGQNTATAIIATAVNTYHSLTLASFSSSQPSVISIFVKAGSKSNVEIEFGSGQISFNLSTQTINYQTNATGTIESYGNGWYRISAIVPSCSYIAFIVMPGTGTSEGWTGDGTTTAVYYYGAQLNIGSTAKPYFPTTDRLNVPRLTYQNGGGGCPSLLLEKQSTNLALYSEQFDNAAWSKFNTTISANVITSPDGTQNADKIVENSNNSFHSMDSAFVSNTGVYSSFVYAKKGERKYLRLIITETSPSIDHSALFDLENGVVLNNTTGVTATIQAQLDGWYKINMTSPALVGGQVRMALLMQTTTQSTSQSYQGDGTSGLYIWGAQLEKSSYSTSYIPTTSSSATRVADAMTVNLPNTNMTFTAYLECEEAPLGTTATDWLQIYNNASILGRAYGYDNVFGFADAYSLGVESGTKMVWKQESGSTAKIFTGGALVGTSTTGTYSNPFNRFSIYGAYLTKSLKIKQFVFFDNALTDAECAQLTA